MAVDAEKRPLLLFLMPYSPPTCYGGAVRVYMGLLTRLSGFRVVILADRQYGMEAESDAWDKKAKEQWDLRVMRFDAFEFHLRNKSGQRSRLKATLALARFYIHGRRQWRRTIATLKPDLVVNGGSYSAGWLTHDLDRAIPLVNYLHGEELTMRMRPRWLMIFMRRRQMKSIRRADATIAVSTYTASLARLLSKVASGKVQVLPNFADTERFLLTGRRDALRASLGWGQKLVILTLARLDARKGIDQALRALAMLDQEERLPSHWIYIIAGRGKERQSLESLCESLKLQGRVFFRDFVPDAEVADLYEAADIFLQPNREIDGDTEGFGLVYLEANACGIPVIGGIAGGTADAIAEGVSGFRVDGESTEAVARAIEVLAQDAELRTRMGRQGAERVRVDFNVDVAATRFNKLLWSVLARHSNA